MPVPNTAIVFGGSGFIGRHLVSALAKSGSKVVVADVVLPADLPPSVEFRFCDLRDPITIPVSHQFDAVFHLAAVHRTPGHEPYEYYEANVGGANNLVDWMESGGGNALYFTSSIAVYGPSEELKSEESKPEPTSDYGRSKLLAEQIFSRWGRGAPERKLVIARPAVVFGPGEGGNFTRLGKALRRRTFVYPGRDDVVKSCGYVSDLVNAFLWASEQSDQELLFNFCYPHRSTIAEICQAFHDVAGYPLPRMLPDAYVGAALTTLKVINPAETGFLSAARVRKLTASTNIAADVLSARGFAWETDVESALRLWQANAPGGKFI